LDSQTSISTDKIDDNGSGAVSFQSPISTQEALIEDGDGTERQVFVIAAGASDPAAAGADDIILERNS